ncbi:glycine-rich protein-like [Centruroides vittatus]|uniref:glycine-rich protein-like n=1 Tax=Centruroides vittatus TaxID=120091 RepID=UPI00350EE1BE
MKFTLSVLVMAALCALSTAGLLGGVGLAGRDAAVTVSLDNQRAAPYGGVIGPYGLGLGIGHGIYGVGLGHGALGLGVHGLGLGLHGLGLGHGVLGLGVHGLGLGHLGPGVAKLH